MKCPEDGTELRVSRQDDVEIDYCPKCKGVWLHRGELDKIIDQAMAEMEGGQGGPGGNEGGPRGGYPGGRDRYPDAPHRGGPGYPDAPPGGYGGGQGYGGPGGYGDGPSRGAGGYRDDDYVDAPPRGGRYDDRGSGGYPDRGPGRYDDRDAGPDDRGQPPRRPSIFDIFKI